MTAIMIMCSSVLFPSLFCCASSGVVDEWRDADYEHYGQHNMMIAVHTINTATTLLWYSCLGTPHHTNDILLYRCRDTILCHNTIIPTRQANPNNMTVLSKRTTTPPQTQPNTTQHKQHRSPPSRIPWKTQCASSIPLLVFYYKPHYSPLFFCRIIIGWMLIHGMSRHRPDVAMIVFTAPRYYYWNVDDDVLIQQYEWCIMILWVLHNTITISRHRHRSSYCAGLGAHRGQQYCDMRIMLWPKKGEWPQSKTKQNKEALCLPLQGKSRNHNAHTHTHTTNKTEHDLKPMTTKQTMPQKQPQYVHVCMCACCCCAVCVCRCVGFFLFSLCADHNQ